MLMDLVKTKDKSNTGDVFSAPSTPEVKRCAAWLASRLERSKHSRPGEMETETVMITPTLAELMLRHNEDNRPLRTKHVERLADIMRDGRWQLTAQGVSFSRDGKLNDGQHRLAAIVAAGSPVASRVSFGEGREVFSVLDAGKARTGADALHIAGYKYWTNLAAAARLYAQVTSDRPASVPTITNDDILSIIDTNAEMENVCAEGTRVAIKLRSSSAPPIVAFYLIRQSSMTPDKLAAFVDHLADGAELKRRDPILVVRNMIAMRSFIATGIGGSARSNANVRMCAALVLAWNKWLAGKTCSEAALRWSIANDFPQPE